VASRTAPITSPPFMTKSSLLNFDTGDKGVCGTMNSLNDPGRRMLLKSAVALSGVSALGIIPPVAIAQDQTGVAAADTTQTSLQR
jgi:hypothetical protein